MPDLDTTLFLWINATPSTPDVLVDSARWMSTRLPLLAMLTLVPVMASGQAGRRQGAGALWAMLMAWLSVRFLRSGFHAPRPFELGLGHQWIEHASTASFPSLHAAVAGAWATGMVCCARHHRCWWAVGAGAVALGIAWSRVCLGLHFPGDVAVGLAVGAAWGWLAGVALSRPEPTLTPSGWWPETR